MNLPLKRKFYPLSENFVILERSSTSLIYDSQEFKSYLRVDYKKELYDALVKSYNTYKDLFESYGEVFMLKKCRDNKDKDQDPSVGSYQGTKRRKSSKETESSRDPKSKESKSSSSSKGPSRSQHKSSGKSAHAEEPSQIVDDLGARHNQEFDMGHNDEQPDDEAVSKDDWFKKPERPPTPDPDWNKRQHVDFRPPQTWISDIAHVEKPRTSFDELMDTPIDFSAFVMNRLNITNLTQELLVGPAINLLKGTCKSPTKLEYHFEECLKATTERLDWHNPEHKQYLFDLRKPLLLIPDRRGRQVIPLEYFINNNLEYLKGGDLSKKYSTSVVYDKHAYWGTSHWGPKRQQFYGWVEDLQLGVESYQKKLNLAKPDTFRPYLRKRTAFTAYSDPQGVIYIDKNNKNRLMRTDELYKFIDGTLNSVQTTLHDITSGIRMEYLPKKKWSNLDKRRARVMI
ncbi:hypothetical protein Tco_0529150 [Tanacetum coccineum]